MSSPFFSIGITTYNRHQLLKEALSAILAQDFSDFEVLVGNDYQAEILTSEMLGISDPRIRIINHPHNLREVGNMNALLTVAAGRYFTWLFDDDLYEPNFLQTAYKVLTQTGFPPLLFTGVRVTKGLVADLPGASGSDTLKKYTGQEFLLRYSATHPTVISTCGLYDTAVLRNKIGGVEELSTSAIGLYSEYVLLVKCALLERIVIIDTPLVVFRSHSESWGVSNAELDIYRTSGRQLLLRAGNLLQELLPPGEFNRLLLTVVTIHLTTFVSKSARAEIVDNSLGLAAARRAIARFLVEAEETEAKSFPAAGGRRSLASRWHFSVLRLRGIVLIPAILAVNAIRRMRNRFRIP